MQTAYQVLSAIVLFGIPMQMITYWVVIMYRNNKKTGESRYKFWLRLRNYEFYLVGVCYPLKAIIGLIFIKFEAVDVIWGIIWFLLALMIFQKYRFGTISLVEDY